MWPCARGLIMDSKILWVCGEYAGQDPASGITAWSMVGIFEKETRAVQCCKTENHFVGPLELNKQMPDEPIVWEGVYYPLLSGATH